jgi:hypothetical protein
VFSVSGDIGRMADPSKILAKVSLHLNSHSVLQKIIFFSQELRGEVSQALLSILAVRGTAKIDIGVQESMAALLATTGGVVLKKLHFAAALGAPYLKNGPWSWDSLLMVRLCSKQSEHLAVWLSCTSHYTTSFAVALT